MPRKKKTPDTELGRKLMQIRLENNLSVLGMAERIGRNKATISRYEDGRTIPDAETITAYCREFDLEPNYLLGWVNSKKDELTEEQFQNLWMKHGQRYKRKVLRGTCNEDRMEMIRNVSNSI